MSAAAQGGESSSTELTPAETNISKLRDERSGGAGTRTCGNHLGKTSLCREVDDLGSGRFHPGGRGSGWRGSGMAAAVSGRNHGRGLWRRGVAAEWQVLHLFTR